MERGCTDSMGARGVLFRVLSTFDKSYNDTAFGSAWCISCSSCITLNIGRALANIGVRGYKTHGGQNQLMQYSESRKTACAEMHQCVTITRITCAATLCGNF